jgi:hypothetical protein
VFGFSEGDRLKHWSACDVARSKLKKQLGL